MRARIWSDLRPAQGYDQKTNVGVTVCGLGAQQVIGGGVRWTLRHVARSRWDVARYRLTLASSLRMTPQLTWTFSPATPWMITVSL